MDEIGKLQTMTPEVRNMNFPQVQKFIIEPNQICIVHLNILLFGGVSKNGHLNGF
jgi:hypothetical protein